MHFSPSGEKVSGEGVSRLRLVAVRRHWKFAVLVVAVVLALSLWLAPAVAAVLMLGLVGALFVLAVPASVDVFVRGPGYQYREDVPTDDEESGLDLGAGIEATARVRREVAPAPTAPVRTPASAQQQLLSWPSTRDGMRTAKLSLAVLGLVLLDRLLASTGYYDESRTTALGAMMVVGFGIVLGAAAADLRAISALRSGDRSIVLLLPLLPTAAAVAFLVREVVLLG